MENRDDMPYRADPDNDIRITDLGTSDEDHVLPAPAVRPRWSGRSRVLIGFAAGATLLATLALLSPINDEPAPPKKVEAAVKIPSACEAVEQAEQAQAAVLAGLDEDTSAQDRPLGYTVYTVMTSNTTSFPYAMSHPDGSLEVCEEAALSAPFDLQFPTEDELGRLPEGMTYAYDSFSSFVDGTLTLDLEGVRLADGTVVDHVVLPDGRGVPALPVPEG